jgi:hypothetical protein
LYTFITPAVELKYNAPVRSALPSLSTVGSDDLAPKYLSSKESKEAAALVSEVAALLAEVLALLACVLAVVALLDALVA